MGEPEVEIVSQRFQSTLPSEKESDIRGAVHRGHDATFQSTLPSEKESDRRKPMGKR